MRWQMVVAVVALVGASYGEARADGVVSVTGGVGLGASSLDHEALFPRGLLLVRVTAAGRVAPPPMPASRGYDWRGGWAPELSVATVDDGTGDARLYLAGARLEAAFAQREMGLLRVSARGSVWLAARAGIASADSGAAPAGELAFGYQLELGDSGFLLGGDLGYLVVRQRQERPLMSTGAVPHGGTGTETGAFHGVYAGLFVARAL